MRCPVCQHEIPDAAKACGHCGHRLSAAPHCPYCGGEVSQSARVCGHCGRRLAAEPAEAPKPTRPLYRPTPPPPSGVAPPPRRPKRGVPRWVWALVAGASALLVLGVLVAVVVVGLLAAGVINLPGGQAAPPVVTPRPLPTSSPAPAATVRPSPTAEPSEELGEPVLISIMREEESAPANAPVILTIGWVADTEEQVADFVASLDLEVTLDGDALPNVADYWDDVEEFRDEDGDGDVDYVSHWGYPVGVLEPGRHQVVTEGVLRWLVTDGLDLDEDGAPDRYEGTIWQFTLEIVVEE